MARSTPGAKTPRGSNTAAKQQGGPDDNAPACDRAAVQRKQQPVDRLCCAMARNATQGAEA